MTHYSLPQDSTDHPRILVPVDFSEDSRAAVVWAGKHAHCINAELVLLHVVHDLASSPGFYRQAKETHLKPMQEVAESMMEEFMQELLDGNPELDALKNAASHCVPGLPRTRIVEAAKIMKACLVVIGSRGQSSPHRPLGSTSQRVVESAFMPVVVIKSDEHGQLDKKALKKLQKAKKKEAKRLRKLLGLAKKEVMDETNDE